jgi:putative transposase
VEGDRAPYSAKEVAQVSRDTDFGKAPVVLVCAVFGLSRAAYYAAQRALAAPAAAEPIPTPPPSLRLVAPTQTVVAVDVLREAIQAIAEAHPAWGVRKVHAMLRRKPYEVRTSRKRVWALMRDMKLCFPAGARPGEVPRGTVAVALPNRLWATDLTTVWTEEDGLVAIVPVIDCGCRSLLELRVTKSQESPAILSAVTAALVDNFDTPAGVPEGLGLRTDHGPQYTGADCDELCKRWNVDHTLAPVGRPTGNAVAERVIRTMKEECLWLRDWKSLAEVQAGLDAWRRMYNEERPHQSLHWNTPSEVRASHRALKMAA